MHDTPLSIDELCTHAWSCGWRIASRADGFHCLLIPGVLTSLFRDSVLPIQLSNVPGDHPMFDFAVADG